MIEAGVSKAVGGIVLKAMPKVYSLYQVFRDRDDSRQSFAR